MRNCQLSEIFDAGVGLSHPGAALTQQYKKTGKIVLCSFGDGASNEGTFHEGINLSSIWKLPIIFYCENNLYGMSSYESLVHQKTIIRYFHRVCKRGEEECIISLLYS